MNNKKKYYLYIEKTKVEVSYDIYKAYYHYKRKENYFLKDLKEGRERLNPGNNKKMLYPSKEDSFDRINKKYGELLGDNKYNPENIFIKKEILENLYFALNKLNPDERDLIYGLFYQNKSEMEIAREKGLTRGKIRYLKEKIFSKLKNYL